MEASQNVPEHNSHKDNNLAGEHKITDVGQIILFIIFVLTIIVDKFMFKFSFRTIGSLPYLISIPIFVLLFMAGSYFIIQSHGVVFGKGNKESRLIQEGVFSMVRHPMYFGSILLFLSFVVFSYSILSFLVWLVICLFYYFISKYEEQLLIKQFGDVFREYRKKVPMFIPFLKSIP